MIPKYQRIADRLKEQFTGQNHTHMTKLPTEKELCALYGVSRQTVRQALHILEHDGLIERRQGSGAYATGLLPDSAHNQIAVLLPTDSDYTYARLRSDLQAPLTKAGFTVSFYLTEHSVAKEREILQLLLKQPLRGLIIDAVKNALPNPNLDLYEKLWAAQTATVFLHAPYANFPPHTAIVENNVAGGQLLARYLIESRHTHLAGIFRSDTLEGQDRYLGFARQCTAAGLPWNDEDILWYTAADLISLQKKQALGFLADFIHQKTGTCSAIVCQDDEIAYWAVKLLTRSGISVPDDISIVSFDNSYLCDFSVPTLTSLAHRDGEPGILATQALLAQIRGQKGASVTLHWELVVRESSAPLA